MKPRVRTPACRTVRRASLLFIPPLVFLSLIPILPAFAADSPEVMAAKKFKPLNPQYYEKMVRDLEDRHLVDGHMREFQSVAKDLIPNDDTEGFHQLALALYDRGHEEECAYILDTYVTPRKRYSPGEGLDKATEIFEKYQKTKK